MLSIFKIHYYFIFFHLIQFSYSIIIHLILINFDYIMLFINLKFYLFLLMNLFHLSFIIFLFKAYHFNDLFFKIIFNFFLINDL